jgi:hypothetical protein
MVGKFSLTSLMPAKAHVALIPVAVRQDSGGLLVECRTSFDPMVTVILTT